MTYKSFKFEIADGIAHITFNQPERGNPMDLDFNTELSRSQPSATKRRACAAC